MNELEVKFHELSFITELLRHIQGSERVCRIRMMALEGSLETSPRVPHIHEEMS